MTLNKGEVEFDQKTVVKIDGKRYGVRVSVCVTKGKGTPYGLITAMRHPYKLHNRDSATVIRSKAGFRALLVALNGQLGDLITKSMVLPDIETKDAMAGEPEEEEG